MAENRSLSGPTIESLKQHNNAIYWAIVLSCRHSYINRVARFIRAYIGRGKFL